MDGKSNKGVIWSILAAGALVALAVLYSTGKLGDLISPDEFKEVKAAVANELVDPNSAMFKDMREVAMGYCGMVNGKNSFGGFAGYQEFNAYQDQAGVWKVTLDPELVKILCH